MRKTQTIMIVDDDDDDRQLFCEAVSEIDIGIKCVDAENGELALKYLQDERYTLPDFIFLDLNMPRLNGKQCLAEIKKLDHLKRLFPENNPAREGIEELSFLVKHTKNINLEVDVTLARGLNYYTGIIFEPKAPLKIKMGSIGGGGRYDDLTGLFGVDGIAGVGISFGVDRIYDVLEELNLFPADLDTSVQVLFFNMGANESITAISEMKKLRKEGVSCELFHEQQKMDKQFRYAERKKIPFVIFLGSQEISEGAALVKNLKTGDQEKVPLHRLPLFFKKG